MMCAASNNYCRDKIKYRNSYFFTLCVLVKSHNHWFLEKIYFRVNMGGEYCCSCSISPLGILNLCDSEGPDVLYNGQQLCISVLVYNNTVIVINTK